MSYLSTLTQLTEKLKLKLRQLDPSLDLRDGSAINDLVVFPIASMLEPYEAVHEANIQKAMINSSGLSEDDLDIIASNFFIERESGTKATGNVRIYFSSKKNITIPVGSRFKSKSGLIYKATKTRYVTADAMGLERYPYYSSNDIPVEAEEMGDVYRVDAGEITEWVDRTTSYQAVTNIVAITGGVDKETNAELYDRLLVSQNVQAATSTGGINKVLINNYPNVQNVGIVGAGDTLMIRDLNYDRGQLENYNKIDFNGCKQWQHWAPYNKSVIMMGKTGSDPYTVSGVYDFPVPSVFLQEVTDDMYLGVYAEDSYYCTAGLQELLYDNFNPSGVHMSGLSPVWFASTTERGLSSATKEIIWEDNMVRLGVQEYDVSSVYLSEAILDAVLSGLEMELERVELPGDII